MQNTTLPVFSSPPAAPASAAPNRQGANAADGAQFAQTLARQQQQRQQDAQAAQSVRSAPPAPASGAARSQQSAPAATDATNAASASTDNASTTPAPTATAPAAEQGARAASGKGSGSGSDPASDTDSDSAQDPHADLAGASPMAGLIAIVASFNQPAAPVAAPAGSAVDGKRADQVALQADLLAAGGAGLAASRDGAHNLAQMFDHARAGAGASARSAVADGAAGATAGTAKVAASTDNSAPLAAAADSGAAFGGVLQAHVDAAPGRAGERAELPLARELASATAAAPLSAPLQQASLAPAQAAIAPPDRLSARVGSAAWDTQVGQKIVWMAAGQEQTATLTLNPPDLGPVQVVLSVSNDMAQVTFSSAQPEVRAALEQAMPRLRDMMGESGIALGNASVNDGAQQRQAQQGEQSNGRGGRGRFGADANGSSTEPAVRRGRILSADGAVDTFA
ncbi:flagellar hook-length control protein FliK [Massilia sp. PWRC2]|uniref:flagellar hook-length control protein FliK n=1 Tax=Massilia sp. PWRC2 TaxID=2804626 RepID=UPI003CEA6B41